MWIRNGGVCDTEVGDADPPAFWMVSRVAHLVAAVILISAFALAAPAGAQVAEQSSTASLPTLTPERIAAATAAVVALIGAVVGGLALARSARTRTGDPRRGAMVALVMGPVGLLGGALVVATADGGLGTGNGLAGGVVAMVVGLIGIVCGGLTLVRARRIA